MKKFLKDTRGVVMMEYIILGLFAVAVTIASVHVLGKTYNNGLLAMARATLGNTNAVVDTIAHAAAVIDKDVPVVQKYGVDLTTAGADAGVTVYEWEVYDAL